MLNWIVRNRIDLTSILCIAQSAGAVEYTDCTSAEGKDPTNECAGYNTKQSDGVVPVILGLRVMSSLPGPLWLGEVAFDRVLSTG